MLSRFLLVFKMSVLDIIRETASFLASEVCLKTENATASDSIAQWTMGTFSVDAKDSGKGKRESVLVACLLVKY